MQVKMAKNQKLQKKKQTVFNMKIIPFIPIIGLLLAKDEDLEDNVIFISSMIVQSSSIVFLLVYSYHL